MCEQPYRAGAHLFLPRRAMEASPASAQEGQTSQTIWTFGEKPTWVQLHANGSGNAATHSYESTTQPRFYMHSYVGVWEGRGGGAVGIYLISHNQIMGV